MENERTRRLIASVRRRSPMTAGALMNVARLARVIVSAETLNVRDISELHETHLLVRRARLDHAQALVRAYPQIAMDRSQRKALRSQETRVHSQNGEDGILLYLLSTTGPVTGRAVEVGSGGWSSNIANLVVHFAFRGLFLDGDEEALDIQRGRLVQQDPGAIQRSTTQRAWVTPDNIGELLLGWSDGDPIDVASIDVDGNDYWLLSEFRDVRPTIVVSEYNASFGPEASVTIPFDPSFDRWAAHPSGWYHGASLTALTKVAGERGYALVGCESAGVNAFFVRRDALPSGVREVSASEAYWPDARRTANATADEQLRTVMALGPMEV